MNPALLAILVLILWQAPEAKKSPAPKPIASDAKPPSTAVPKPLKIYRYEAPSIAPQGFSENIEVEELKGDQLKVTVLPGGREVRDRFIFPLGSRNIHVKVNPEVGSTYLADLRFKDNCIVTLRSTGAVEVPGPGIRAEDVEGNRYVSKRVPAGDKAIFVMVEDDAYPRKPESGLAVMGTLVNQQGAPSPKTRVCIVTPTEDSRMAIPFSLKGGRIREASAVSDAAGRFTILTDPFTVMHLALCEAPPVTPGVPIYKKSLAPIRVESGKWLMEMGKVVVD